MSSENRSGVAAVALLGEPVRRELYEWVVGQGRAVSREEAAAGTGVSRSLAAFHLDRLADAGLLSVEYRRLSGRTGPGAGRPAKLYRRASDEVSVSLPPRTYEAAARLLAEAVEDAHRDVPPPELREAAARAGRQTGAAARCSAGPRAGRQRHQQALLEALAERGYEPVLVGGEIRLRNCPFHALVEEHRQLVCGMNLALTGGVLEGLGATEAKARLEPEPGYCCVRIESGPGA